MVWWSSSGDGMEMLGIFLKVDGLVDHFIVLNYARCLIERLIGIG